MSSLQQVKQQIQQQALIAPTARILGEVSIGKDVVIHDFVTIYPKAVIEDGAQIFEGAIIGRPPNGANAVARKVSSEFKTTKIGKGCVISPHAVIYSDVELGDGTLIGDHASVREQSRIGKNCIIGRSVTVFYNAAIGDNTKIMDHTNITGNIKIGSRVFISTLVATTNDNNFGKLQYDQSIIQGPVIGDDVAIGAGANILPAIHIGNGAIVGAGAVVTKDVPPKKLVMGIPARVVRDLE